MCEGHVQGFGAEGLVAKREMIDIQHDPRIMGTIEGKPLANVVYLVGFLTLQIAGA